ncbi:MAG: PP0621 family protein [Pararobbsia sp.]
MFSRLILLILVGLFANWFWRNFHRQREAAARVRRDGAAQTREGGAAGAEGRADAGRASTRGGAGARASRRAGGERPALAEPMVRCAHCHTHLPISEATSSLGRHFCHPRHAHEYAARVAQAGDGR